MPGSSLWVDFVWISFAAFLLTVSAKFVVDTAASLAVRLRVSELVIGLTVVAAGTSAPEFGVTIVAALEGQNEISVGNVVGSNIFNLGFILGGAALLGTIPASRQLVSRDATVLVGSSLMLLLLVGLDLRLGHWDGLLLVLGLVAYLRFVWLSRFADGPPPMSRSARSPFGVTTRRLVGILLLALAGVALSSHLLIQSATSVALKLGLSEWMVAVTIVAAGTSLPEMATTLVGLARRHYAVGVGNLIGSDLFNLLGVLGVAGLIQSMELSTGARGSLFALAGMSVLVLLFLRSGWRITRWEGLALVALGVLRWILDFSPTSFG
jgi:cation:H+ antiporter